MAFLTAYYALHHVARLGAGERVLIHAASGGVGLAAVQIAQRIGAEIYATAGSPEKREWLQSLGVHHVMDSRSLAFANEVREKTGGEGVDVVLNSLAGPLLTAGVDLLRDHGRFIELGKRDVLENSALGLRPFLRNLTFSLVDLIGMMRQRPARVRALLEEVLGHVQRGALPPLPHRLAPADQAESLFREMASARHVGKLVMAPPAPSARLRPRPIRARRDGSYLVTGGLGALGRMVALHLAKQGAGHLVLLGRAGATTEAQRRDLDAMRAAGAGVSVVSADVADREALARALEGLPFPLRGVAHAAGIVGEEPLRTLDAATFAKVIAPKVAGGWNLHQLTLGAPLDFFLLFGSVSGVLGAPGQAHYAAGNAFLDGLAHLRRRQGLPATSLDFGPIARVGMASRADLQDRFARMGIRPLPPETVLAAIDRALEGGTTQATLASFAPGAGGGLATWARGAAAPENDRRAELAALSGPERRDRLQAWLREQIAAVLGARPADVGATTSFSELGLDSLMALELRNRIQRDLGLSLSATVALSHDSVSRLGEHLTGRLDHGTGGAAPEPAEAVKLRDLPSLATLPEDVRPSWTQPAPARLQRALLTGATGFLGSFLLRELLERGLHVECLVRAESDAQGLSRIRSTLERYGLWRDAYAERLGALRGDLGRPRLGLSEADLAALADRLDLVLHGGAAVNWVLPYRALEPINVGGIRELLRLCCAGRPKALHYVSTLGTIGVYRALGMAPPGVDPQVRMPRLQEPNGYFQTKWVGEQLVLEARRRGLRASVYRPGLITGDSRTGADSATSGQFFFSLIKGCIQMGCAPSWRGSIRVVPVDFVARAVVSVALLPEGQGADVNLTNRRPLAFTDLVEKLRGMGFFLLDEEWRRWREDVLALPRTSPGNALAPFATFLRGLPPDEDAALEVFGGLDPLDDAPARALLGGAGVVCPPVDDALIQTYTRWYLDAGALAPPSTAAGAGEESGTL
ncbi:MAG TPA: thioester reductase domain-containing protein [Myxococcales bacterium]|nr:thioester reductase domain-containing protein [Myxococcales bacterium]